MEFIMSRSISSPSTRGRIGFASRYTLLSNSRYPISFHEAPQMYGSICTASAHAKRKGNKIELRTLLLAEIFHASDSHSWTGRAWTKVYWKTYRVPSVKSISPQSSKALFVISSRRPATLPAFDIGKALYGSFAATRIRCCWPR
jgi:hypothetical protein